MNGILNDGLLGTDDEVGRVDGLAKDIGGAAGVGAGVLGVDVHDVEGDKAKVKTLTET